MTGGNFSISYWNVHGLHCPTTGCELQTTDFFNNLMKYDISIISETWGCKHPIFLSGYNFYKINPNKYKKIKSGRSSGGIIENPCRISLF